MFRSTRALTLAALAIALTAGMAAAQQTPAPVPPATVPAKPMPPPASSSTSTTWDQTKAMTRKEWNAAKRKWAMEKVKWRDCNQQADAERLKAPKSWSFIANCMTKT